MEPTAKPPENEELKHGPVLDLRRVRQFVVLAETLNFRRAAERLHMAQPPLSVSIQKLEAELDTRLFERGGASGVSLTPAGRAVLDEARRLLFHDTQLRYAATMAAQGTGGVLHVGFVGSTTYGALQRIVRIFRAEYPGVELILTEGTSARIMEYVNAGELNVGIVRTPIMTISQATLITLLTEKFIAALPLGSPLAARPELRMRDLAHESFVFYTRTEAAGLHAMAILACQLAGFLPRVTQQAIQVQTVLSLVESGLGVALVPAITQYAPNPRIAYRRVMDIPDASSIGLALALHATRASPAATRFSAIATKALSTNP